MSASGERGQSATADGGANPSRLRRIREAFATPAAGVMFFLGFGSGLPILMVGQTLNVWLRDVGYALSLIGLISYAGNLYALKFIWAPLLDWRGAPLLGFLGFRRGWLCLSQILLVISIGACALVDPNGQPHVFLICVILLAFAGATQDTMVDAYRVEIAPVDAQGALTMTYSFGYRGGLICGGAMTLYIAQFSSWRAAYLTMAAAMLVPLITTVLAREPDAATRTRARPNFALAAILEPFFSFFRQRGWKLALALLAFVGLYKLPDQMLGVISGPFYLDSGFTKADIANVSKLFGSWMGIAGTAIGAVLIASAFSLRGMLLAAALGVATSNLLFILMALYPGEYWAFVVAILGDNFSQGFAGAVLVAYMSSLVAEGYTATQYALLSSLANLPGKVIGGVSGFMVESWGYITFYVISAVSLLPTLVLLAWLWSRIPARPGADGAKEPTKP